MQDVDAFAAHLPDDALLHPHTKHWVAGARATEGGLLAPFAGASCSGSRHHICLAEPSSISRLSTLNLTLNLTLFEP